MKKHLFLLLLLPLLFSDCSQPELNEWTILTIKEDTHRARPYRFTWHERIIEAYTWQFDDSAVYNLGNADQCDWNKLWGLSFHEFTNHKNSLLVAWRYDLSGKLLIAPYYHENNNTWWASALCSSLATSFATDPDLPHIEAQVGEEIETHFNIAPNKRFAAVTIINADTGQTAYFEHYFDTNVRRHRDIYPWFGGTSEAPHDITIRRKLIAQE